MNGYLVFALAVTIVFGANTFASYAVGRSKFYDSRQKAVQIALVWLLPIFGLLLVGGVLWSIYERPSATGANPEHKIPDFVLAIEPGNFFERTRFPEPVKEQIRAAVSGLECVLIVSYWPSASDP